MPLLLVGTNARKLRVVHAPDGVVAAERAGHHAGSVYCVAAVASGATVVAATGSNDKLVKVVTLGVGGRSEAGRVEVRSRDALDVVLRGHTGTVRSVCFDRGGAEAEDEWRRTPSHGRRLLSAGAGTFAIRVWSLDEAGGRQAAALSGHSAAVFELRSSGSDGRIASASADGSVRLWDVRQQRCALSFNAPGTGVCSVALQPGSGRGAGGSGLVAIGCADGSTLLADTATGTIRRRLAFHAHEVRSLDFSRDGAHLLTSSFDGAVAAWRVDAGDAGDAGDGRPITSVLDAHRNKILQLRTLPMRSSRKVPPGSFVSSDASGVVTMWRPMERVGRGGAFGAF